MKRKAQVYRRAGLCENIVFRRLQNNEKKDKMSFVKYLRFILIILTGMALFQCKKNPTIPNADVLNRPVIWVNTFEFAFAASTAGDNPAPQILKIKNAGKETLNYTISSEAAWVGVTEENGTSSGQVTEHTISVDKSDLPAQQEPHAAVLTITSTEAYNNPQTITVSLALSAEPPPIIQASPEKLNFSGQVGGKNPSSQTIQIQNSGGGTLKFNIATDEPWLSVDPDNGQSKTKKKTVEVHVDSDGLKEGTYRGKVEITDPNATNSPQIVRVTLIMSEEDPPKIGVRPNRLSFQSFTGSNPPAQNLYVQNTGGGTLKYAVDWSKGWLDVSPNGGTSNGPEKQHTVSIDSGGLSAGTYTDSIIISDPDADNSPYSINVTLTVIAPLTDNEVGVSLSPSSGGTNTTVQVAINVRGNTSLIEAFGLQVNFNTTMFQYVGTSKGSLTGNWSLLGGNQISPGVIRIGGAALGGTPVAVGSLGTIAVVTLRVTCTACNDGQTSPVSINGFSDDLVGMTVSPASATFAFKK